MITDICNQSVTDTNKKPLVDFRNEAFTDFANPVNRDAMLAAIAKVKANLGQTYPLIINGQPVETSDYLVSTNPGAPKEIIGRFSKATTKLADAALNSALVAFESWKHIAPSARAEVLFKVAELMRKRRHELSAWMILEIGKTWAEADGDTAEAIDFCEFYAREMLRLSHPQELVKYPGEDNQLSYIPLGVGLVIPPWNFPLAILVGMTTASLVAGNTVILKPSSETPTIAFKFMELLQEAGLPKGVVNFLPGPGASVGDYLVSHPKIRFIAFTGSKEVGLHINELAAKAQPGQLWIKRVIAEMGGKDSILVDSGVDTEAAAAGIVASAFGFQGQKCSACSRAILHKDIYNEVLDQIIQKTKALKLGVAEKHEHQLGPVASKSAYASILDYIEIGKKEGRLMTGGGHPETDQGGFFVEPTVIADVAPDARIAQEEIFGPVLAVIKAESWEQGLAIANNTEFGLTGAVYSNNRGHLEEARQKFHVGNLYLNRKCTGALVGVHPFGGFNMSGTDSKAGGRDYLLLFTQAKVVSEKV